MRVGFCRLLAALLFSLAVANPAPATAAAGLRFDLQLHDVAEARDAPLRRLTHAALRDVQGTLRVRLDGRLKVHFVGSDAAFAQVLRDAGGRGGMEPWLDGLALLNDDRIIVRLGGKGILRTGEVTRHEIAHIAIHALAGDRYVPRWFHEGVAMWVAGEATLDRLQESVGAGAFDQLSSVDHLEAGFSGHRVAVQRAYALSAGFIRFCVQRTGDSGSVADLHRRMALGLDFTPAFTATFGLQPNALFGVYAHFVGAAGSKWTQLLSDSMLWTLIGLLALVAMTLAWLRRPRFDGEPMDLEAIALAGEEAIRTGVVWMPVDEPAVVGVPSAAVASDPEPEGPTIH